MDNPAGYSCYDKEEVNRLSDFITACDLDRRNLAATQEHYDRCKKLNYYDEHADIKIWASVFGGLIVGFLAGAAR